MVHLTKCILICLFLLYGSTNSVVLIADYAMNRMIELMARRPFCKLHTDRGDIQRMLLKADPSRIRQVPRENVLALEEVCIETGGLSQELQGGLGFIYPGTKWCGPGNIASNYEDIGRYAEEDKCCREHDLCPNILSPGECKRGLCNSQSFTRSHCDCDARFRRCLQGLNTETANTLGAAFFNVVQITCFKERRPCSIHQSKNCPLENFLSGLYTSFPILPTLNKLFHYHTSNSIALTDGSSSGGNDQSMSRSLKKLSTSASISGRLPNELANLPEEDRIRLASLGLIAKNLFKDVVVRQVQGFYQFYNTAREIIDGK